MHGFKLDWLITVLELFGLYLIFVSMNSFERVRRTGLRITFEIPVMKTRGTTEEEYGMC